MEPNNEPLSRPTERNIRMKKMLSALTVVTASALALTGCAPGAASTTAPATSAPATSAAPQNITLWVAGGDTPAALRDYIRDYFSSLDPKR